MVWETLTGSKGGGTGREVLDTGLSVGVEVVEVNVLERPLKSRRFHSEATPG